MYYDINLNGFMLDGDGLFGGKKLRVQITVDKFGKTLSIGDKESQIQFTVALEPILKIVREAEEKLIEEENK